jgi:eukaryotic-like serine/threonine-protein kinase
VTEADDDPPLAVGTALAHYVLGRRIGAGAMGAVYEANDTSLDRTVAIKVVAAALSDEPGMAERIVREARSAARANHPNLIHVYFVGRADGRPFYAMELVPGEDLERAVTRDGPMSLEAAVDALVQAACGLAAAHAVGVVHRDVKPSNLLRLPDGRVKVTDFGLSKSLGGDPGASHVGSITGTPTYMSPEQCRGEAVDPRTDVYSLGLTAWFLLTGKPAYGGPSLGAVLNAQMNAPLPSLTDARPELSREVDRVLRRLCEKDPARRPATMTEVVALLEGVRPRRVRLAPLAARGAAMMVDMFVLSIGTSALLFAHSQAEQHFGESATLEVLSDALAMLLAFGLLWGFEARFGATAGKMLFGLRVVRQDGAAPSRRALLARYVLRLPALLVPSIDSFVVKVVAASVQGVAVLAALVCGIVTRGKTLSDLVTRTRVVLADRDVAKKAA